MPDQASAALLLTIQVQQVSIFCMEIRYWGLLLLAGAKEQRMPLD